MDLRILKVVWARIRRAVLPMCVIAGARKTAAWIHLKTTRACSGSTAGRPCVHRQLFSSKSGRRLGRGWRRGGSWRVVVHERTRSGLYLFTLHMYETWHTELLLLALRMWKKAGVVFIVASIWSANFVSYDRMQCEDIFNDNRRQAEAWLVLFVGAVKVNAHAKLLLLPENHAVALQNCRALQVLPLL